MIPWKAKDHAKGHIVFVANRMTGKQLHPFLDLITPAQPPPLPSPKPQPAPPEPTHTINNMPYLYLTQPGAVLRKSGDRFLVDHDGGIILDVPYHRLEHILIFGNIQVTGQAMAEALEHNIALSLFSRQGKYRGSLTGPPGQNVRLRLRQYQIHQDPTEALNIARECIRFKIENALTVLERYEERQDLSSLPGGDAAAREVDAAELQMAEIQGRLDDVESLETLLVPMQ